MTEQTFIQQADEIIRNYEISGQTAAIGKLLSDLKNIFRKASHSLVDTTKNLDQPTDLSSLMKPIRLALDTTNPDNPNVKKVKAIAIASGINEEGLGAIFQRAIEVFEARIDEALVAGQLTVNPNMLSFKTSAEAIVEVNKMFQIN